MFLAQTMETAEKTVGLLERINAGGVPLIALCVAVVATIGFIWQLKRNMSIEREWREAGKTDADKRLSDQKDLMREMLARDKEATAATTAAVSAVEGHSAGLKDHDADMKRKLDEVLTRLQDVERALRASGKGA
jgi:hypothetical protein